MRKFFTFAAAVLASMSLMAADYEVYFVKASENPGTQSTIFNGAPSDGGNLSATFTVDGTEYTTARRTSNGTFTITFSLEEGKTGRLWAVHNQSSRHFTLTHESAIDAVTEDTGFSCSTENAYADVFDISEAGQYTLSNSSNIGLVCLILKLEDGAAPSTDPVGEVTIAGPTEGYVGKSVSLKATFDVKPDTIYWTVDGAVQDNHTATLNLELIAERTYQVACWARNQYNAAEEWKSANHNVVATVKPAAVPCATIIPASSGTAPTEVGAEIDLDLMSEGGKLIVAGMKTPGESFVYSQYGLGFMKGGADSIRVEFDYYIAEGSVIKLVIVSNGTGDRGLKLQTLAKSTLLDASWNAAAAAEVKEFEYEVPAGSALIGKNQILLQRNNSVYLQSISMADCGDPVPGTGTDYTPVLNVNKSSVDLDVTAAVAEPTASVVYTGKHLVPGEYALTVPDLAGLTVDPVAVTVGADSLLNATINLSFTSDVELAAASSSISLTIGDLTKSVTINYSATLAKAYMSSLNIEQFVLDNGKSGDIASALTAAHIDFANINDLDSLNDLENKANRNYAYLGLKLKTSGAFIAGWIHAGDTINVKFGAVGGDIKVKINGAEQTFAKADLENNVLGRRAATEEYLELITTSGSTVVLKQIMINENTAEVELPAPSAYLITCAEAEHGSVTVNWEDKKYRTPVGATVTVTPTPAEGYHVASVTAGDAVLVPVEGVYSFVMIAQDITVAATFEENAAPVVAKHEVSVALVDHAVLAFNNGLKLDSVQVGAEVIITDTIEEGYHFVEWNVYKKGDVNTKVTVANAKFNMPDYDVVIAAVYAEDEPTLYLVTIAATEHGTIIFTDVDNEDHMYAKGDEVHLNITADEGYKLVSASAGNEALLPDEDGNCSFVMPGQAVTVSATFEENSGQGFDNIDATVKATKRLINGKLFIEKNGKLYDAQGAMVK